jgi:mRNA interferase MazF
LYAEVARKHPVKIQAAPKVGSLYWCSLPSESCIHIPEFWKKRPVIVISRSNKLSGKVVVLPVTTDEDNEIYEGSLELSETTRNKINGKRCWVVFDHPMTVATSRLDFINKRPPRVEQDELSNILVRFHATIAGWHQQAMPRP